MTSKRPLLVPHVVERDEAGFVLLVDQHRMALREGAALAVLAGEPDAVALVEQGREGKRLAHGPVDVLAGVDGFPPIVEQALDRLVEVEALRHGGQAMADLDEARAIDAGLTATIVLRAGGRAQACPAPVEPVGAVRRVVLACLELDIELGAPDRLVLSDTLGGHHAFGDELVGIQIEDAAVALDLLVHQRLREGRLVALVVAEAPVAEHVDDDRLVEFLPELDRHLGGIGDRLGVVAVHVDDRRLDHLGDVGRIRRRARVARVGREADLVVDDEVDRAAGAVTLQAGQAEALGDDALAGEGRVAVQQQRQHLGALDEIVLLILLRAHLSEHDGIDDLEMRRVGGKRQMHRLVVEGAVRREAEMVLHVARALGLDRSRRAALELVEDRAVRLAHHLAEHVEPAAVRHADLDVLDAERAAALDDLLERRDHALAAVEAEALGAGVAHVEELLEALRLDKLVEDGRACLRA